ncbi:MAG: hypothetical protein E6J41_27270 [Chloroflexi bacterium]|nr:MAG: hypothetical protein E6J41_27270 [Chloroflexota bacterium]
MSNGRAAMSPVTSTWGSWFTPLWSGSTSYRPAPPTGEGGAVLAAAAAVAAVAGADAGAAAGASAAACVAAGTAAVSAAVRVEPGASEAHA